MKALRLPAHLREKLSQPVGVLVEGREYRSVALRAREIIRDNVCWCVGDLVVKSFIEIGFIPHRAFIDRKTLRDRYIDTSDIEKLYNEIGIVRYLKNPPGHINIEVIDLIKQVSLESKKQLVIVIGEEDLISLAIMAFAPLGDYLVYGLPSRGVLVILLDESMRRKAEEVLREMPLVEIPEE
ncbi:MAG: DUF359 domain-containing protein [Sulfolobales archaeon]